MPERSNRALSNTGSAVLTFALKFPVARPSVEELYIGGYKWPSLPFLMSCRTNTGERGFLEANDDFEAATFNLLHGFYRQGIAVLRDALRRRQG